MARGLSLGLAVVLATLVAVTVAVVLAVPKEAGAFVLSGFAFVLGQSP